MTRLCLDTLPKELIALIATWADAYSVLQLAATCRSIREGCYDSLVFKEIIQRSQVVNWQSDSLDIAAVAKRCGNNVSSWVRYAVADDLTLRYVHGNQSMPTPESQPQQSSVWSLPWSNFEPKVRAGGGKEVAMLWLPELFVVRHPFMLNGFWRVYLDNPPPVLKAKHLFCLTMAVLAAPGQMIGLEHVLAAGRGQKLVRGDGMESYLWTLCWTILQVRNCFTNRLSVWPFNDAARVPHMPPPGISTMPLGLPSTGLGLPLPFSNTFDAWFDGHNESMAHEAYLTAGSWQGYYTYYGSFTISARQLDPPMKRIQFRRDNSARGCTSDQLPLIARNCVDGIDSFCIRATVTKREDSVAFCGKKIYAHNSGWEWDLCVTPFGLVGYWGRMGGEQVLQRHGSVWLWKGDDE